MNTVEHLKLIFMNAGVGIATAAPDGRFLKVNPKLCEMTGFAEDELHARTFADLTHPDELGSYRQLFGDLLERKPASSLGDLRCIHKQGHVIWLRLSVTPIFGAEGRLDTFVIVAEDSSESKLSEELLRDQREVLEFMVRNRPLNETLARIVRLIEEQAPGVLSTIYLVEDGKLQLGAAPSWPESFVKTVAGCPIGPQAGSCGAAAFHGRRMISTDIARESDPMWGEFRDWILSYGIKAAWSTPVLSKEGKAIGTVSMCWRELKTPTPRHFALVDVATRLMGIAIERDQTEKLIQEQQAKMIASSKLAALGEMAAGLAHEINNPLAIIQVRAAQLVRMVERDQVTPPLLAQVGNAIVSTTQRISKIIRGLTLFAREASSESRKPVPVATLLDDTLAFCRERFKSHGVDLRVKTVPGDLVLDCRPVQLSQVLLNLLNNSHDAIAGQTEQKWIQIEAFKDGDAIVLTVTDSGPGIPEEFRARVFQPFFTTKAVGEGTGLGLSISAGIISSHGGTLQLDDEAANTRFVVRLPVLGS